MMGMRDFEEWQKYQDQEDFIESMFAIMQPDRYDKYRRKKNFLRDEEGVDEVIYTGEDDWNEIDRELEEFGFSNVDIFGEGLN